jgi:hypothetical protein
VLCRVAYVTPDGRRVYLSGAERNKLMPRDREVRREVVRAAKMYGPHGTLVLLRRR